ncbi:MAG: TIGR03617 family F420-dependent LLM class oxidoreductase [Chloroflexi bacterium]|nr:TIGR03617 family F420-dependent LLM class oxidoreductase [Chloroflexota bacterium]
MKLDVIIRRSGDLRHDVEQIIVAEQLGFDGAWVTETAYNPFFALTVAAKATAKIMLGTICAHAFPRSPMVTAQIAWDLARQSEGRFALGLGFGAPASLVSQSSGELDDAAGRMREYVESLRAIWDTFQTDARLRYRGAYYQFRLMAPFFNPGPISHPAIPVYLASAAPSMFQLAGARFNGLHAPLFHTPSYLRAVVLPALAAGAPPDDRSRNTMTLIVPALIVSGKTRDEMRQSEAAARARLARRGSEPAFRQVMRHHGWERRAAALRQLASANSQHEPHDLISDEMLREFAIVAAAGDAYRSIIERYDGLADRVCLEWDAEKRELFETIAASRRAE